jgi:hypothetical protein
MILKHVSIYALPKTAPINLGWWNFNAAGLNLDAGNSPSFTKEKNAKDSETLKHIRAKLDLTKGYLEQEIPIYFRLKLFLK